jgi:hypothetical protein
MDMSDRPEPRPPTITEEVYLATIKMHVTRIEALETALRYYAADDDPYFDRARAALAPEDK